MNNHRLLPKLDFNITNRCNFRCIHCCFKSGETMLDEFSVSKTKEVLSDFKRLGGQRIDITGGEPLLREDVQKIIKIGKGLGLKIELVTNGSLLTDEKFKEFKKLGLDAIAISLDGPDYETYKKIRPVANKIYETVRTNIQKSVKYGFYTKVNTVVFNINLGVLDKISRLCVNWGVNEQGFYYFTPVGRGATSAKEVVDPFLWLKTIHEKIIPFKNKIKLSIESPILEKELAANLNTSCYLKNPWHLQILPDGNVYPCAIMAFAQKPCGNLYKQTLEEIWNDKKLWNGYYYGKNVEPLFKNFGACVCFGDDFKKIIQEKKYDFLCLMCKLKTQNFYETK